jgi:DNA-binding NarL/FixJ family response regulator
MREFGLSNLELATLHLLATQGLSNAELSTFFGVKETAIRSRVFRIFRATGARTRLELVLIVHRHGELAKAAAAAFRGVS